MLLLSARDKLRMPLDELPFSTKLMNAIKYVLHSQKVVNAEIVLMFVSVRELSMVPNVGRKTINEFLDWRKQILLETEGYYSHCPHYTLSSLAHDLRNERIVDGHEAASICYMALDQIDELDKKVKDLKKKVAGLPRKEKPEPIYPDHYIAIPVGF